METNAQAINAKTSTKEFCPPAGVEVPQTHVAAVVACDQHALALAIALHSQQTKQQKRLIGYIYITPLGVCSADINTQPWQGGFRL